MFLVLTIRTAHCARFTTRSVARNIINFPKIKQIHTVGMPAKRKRIVAVEEQHVDATGSMVSSELQEPKPSPETETVSSSRRSTRTRKKAILVKPPPDIVDLGYESPLTELDDDEASLEPKAPSKKRRRRKKDVEPIVYDIPPVETKETTFKGNTIVSALVSSLTEQIRSIGICLSEYGSQSTQTRPYLLLQDLSQRYHSQKRYRFCERPWKAKLSRSLQADSG